MFSSLTNLPDQAMKKADEFISNIVTQASQSAEFELSLSSSASQFSSYTLVNPTAGTEHLEKEAWTSIRGLNISVNNTNGEVNVDYSHVRVDIGASEHGKMERNSTVEQSLSVHRQADQPATTAASGTNNANSPGTQTLSSHSTPQSPERTATPNSSSGHTTATSAVSSMNEASLRSLHAFMLTVTGVDGHELGNAMDKADEEGRLPGSHDRDTYIAEWKELQKDPAFRHDITYDGREALIEKNNDLLADYFAENSHADVHAGITSLNNSESYRNQDANHPISYDSPESVTEQRLSLVLDFLSQRETGSFSNLHFGREHTSFTLDLAFYLGDFSRTQDGKVALTLNDGSTEEFSTRQQGLNIRA